MDLLLNFLAGSSTTQCKITAPVNLLQGQVMLFHIGGSNNLVEHAKIYNIAGYGIHNYSSVPGANVSNNVYRYNDVSATRAGYVSILFRWYSAWYGKQQSGIWKHRS